MKRTAEELLSDISWVQDSALYNRAILELLGSLGKKPFSIDRAQALHELMHDLAENDAEGMRPVVEHVTLFDIAVANARSQFGADAMNAEEAIRELLADELGYEPSEATVREVLKQVRGEKEDER